MFKILQKLEQKRKKEQSLIETNPSAPLKIVLCYPNRYQVGMANLGFQWVYKLFNEQAGIYCDRAFYPDPSEEKIFESKNLPIYSIELKKPISEFNIIAFSLSYELDYIK